MSHPTNPPEWRLDPIIPSSHYRWLADVYSRTGVTLQALADQYGVSRERIRQIISQVDGSATRQHRQHQVATKRQRQRQDLEREFVEACRRALDEDRRCLVCDCWILRKRSSITCSPDCAKDFLVLRAYYNHGEHRRYMARTILANPTKYQAQIEWAKRVSGDDPPPPNRRYIQVGSRRSEILRRRDPELYRALTGDEGPDAP